MEREDKVKPHEFDRWKRLKFRKKLEEQYYQRLSELIIEQNNTLSGYEIKKVVQKIDDKNDNKRTYRFKGSSGGHILELRKANQKKSNYIQKNFTFSIKSIDIMKNGMTLKLNLNIVQSI